MHPTINIILEQQEEKFGITDPKDSTNYDARLTRLIKTAYEQMGERVVVLIDEYDPFTQKYTLGFPNGEVREGFADSLYKYYMEDYVGSQDTLGNAFSDLRFKEITFEQFIKTVRRWYAGIPYSITGKNQNEQLYQSLIYAALMGFGADVQAEDQTADGRMDIALKLPDAIYILELKYGKTADEAIDQIIAKNYAVRFAADVRPVWAVGMNISQDRRTIDSYRIVQVK